MRKKCCEKLRKILSSGVKEKLPTKMGVNGEKKRKRVKDVGDKLVEKE